MNETATRKAWQDMGSYRVRQLHIVIPFVQGRLADETKAWGDEHHAQFVDLTGQPFGYADLIEQLWRDGVGFYVVEQDVVPSDEQFTEMVACQEEWCAGVHKLHDDAAEVWSLGCMKFSDRLLARHFDLLYTGDDENPDGADCLARRLELTGMDGKPMGSDRSWYRVDLALQGVVRQGGFAEPHLHGPAGRHLHRDAA